MLIKVPGVKNHFDLKFFLNYSNYKCIMDHYKYSHVLRQVQNTCTSAKANVPNFPSRSFTGSLLSRKSVIL